LQPTHPKQFHADFLCLVPEPHTAAWELDINQNMASLGGYLPAPGSAVWRRDRSSSEPGSHREGTRVRHVVIRGAEIREKPSPHVVSLHSVTGVWGGPFSLRLGTRISIARCSPHEALDKSPFMKT